MTRKKKTFYESNCKIYATISIAFVVIGAILTTGLLGIIITVIILIIVLPMIIFDKRKKRKSRLICETCNKPLVYIKKINLWYCKEHTNFKIE